MSLSCSHRGLITDQNSLFILLQIHISCISLWHYLLNLLFFFPLKHFHLLAHLHRCWGNMIIMFSILVCAMGCGHLQWTLWPGGDHRHSTACAICKVFQKKPFCSCLPSYKDISNSSFATVHCIYIPSSSFPSCSVLLIPKSASRMSWIRSWRRMLAAKRFSSHMGLQSPHTHTCMFPHVQWIKKPRKEWADSVEVAVLSCTCWS